MFVFRIADFVFVLEVVRRFVEVIDFFADVSAGLSLIPRRGIRAFIWVLVEKFFSRCLRVFAALSRRWRADSFNAAFKAPISSFVLKKSKQ